MLREHKIGAIIAAAGSGRRMGGRLSKQFMEIDGRVILLHTLRHFQSSPDIDVIIPVAGQNHVGKLRSLVRKNGLTKVSEIVVGGRERQDSVWQGLLALRRHNVDIVLVHDAVRPFISQKMIRSVLRETIKYGAAVVAVRPKDTVKFSRTDLFIDKTPDRRSLWLIQTPQAFISSIIYKAFKKARETGFYGTDDASLVERIKGVNIRIIEGEYDNIKITTREDLELAGLIAGRRAAGAL